MLELFLRVLLLVFEFGPGPPLCWVPGRFLVLAVLSEDNDLYEVYLQMISTSLRAVPPTKGGKAHC